jgi:hypothetical protein
MRGTRRSGALFSAYGSRIQANEVLGAVLQGSGSTEAVSGAVAGLRSTAVQVRDSTAGTRYSQFAVLVEALSRLLSWQNAVASAEVEADRFLRSAKLIARNVLREVGNDAEAAPLSSVASWIDRLSDVDEVPQMARSLLRVPLPLPMFAGTLSPWIGTRYGAPVPGPPAIAVAFTSFLIDGMTFKDPQTAEPELIHDLTVQVAISKWPEPARELILEAVSVEPRDSYELPVFSFGRPEGDPPYSVTKSGHMLLRFPQTLLARPLEFMYLARFIPEPADFRLLTEGQRRLHMQCFDPERDPQSGYAQIDKRIFAIRNEARGAPAIGDPELNDFLLLMAAVGGVAGQSLQDNLFPRKYGEGEFQDEMKKLLRLHPRIGSALEEHPRAGGGITDLSFRGIRLELKVEAGRLVALEDAERFLAQTAQYAVGSDRRFAVLAVLDCSPKTGAPASAANDIFLRILPAPTGGTLPILIGVVILRGNLAKPSDLSRKRQD